jgi:hypothetical protein
MNSICKVECHLVDVKAPKLFKQYEQALEIYIPQYKPRLSQLLIDI